MRSIGIAALALWLAVPAAAQQKLPIWSHGEDRIAFTIADIAFPRSPGTLAYKATKDFSHPGEGIDTSIRYETPDGEVWATVYVYLPSLSHSGLAALATEEAIRLNSKPSLKMLGVRSVAVAGTADAAIRADFGHYQERYASSAAFVKAGRWMVKIRVSGPESRRSEVERAMAALLDGMRFSGKDRPVAAARIEPPACPAAPEKPARLIADEAAGLSEKALADSLVAAIDGAGPEAVRSGSAMAPRIGRAWCRTYAQAGDAKVPLLHATGAAAAGDGPRSILLALYSDAGGALEIVRLEDRHILLHHQIGSTSVLGRFDGVPSDAQIARMLIGQGETGKVRATIRLKPNGDTSIELPTAPKGPTT